MLDSWIMEAESGSSQSNLNRGSVKYVISCLATPESKRKEELAVYPEPIRDLLCWRICGHDETYIERFTVKQEDIIATAFGIRIFQSARRQDFLNGI